MEKTVAVKLVESDWEMLFPVETFTIGQQTRLELTPLSLAGLARVSRQLTAVIGEIAELEVTLDDLTQNAPKIVQVVAIILDKSPGILADMSGLDIDDVQRLPLHIALELFNACLDINLTSQESLVKNFKGLGGKVAKFMGGTQTVQ